MLQPPKFKEERVEILHALIKQNPFATLVTQSEHGILADHIPFILDTSNQDKPLGTLLGHVARANNVWKNHLPELEALLIFQGPHEYITPNWYESKKEHGKAVPTWNYVVAHAYGPVTVREDEQWLMAQINTLTNKQEKTQTPPWSVSDAPSDYMAKMLKGIVGIEIDITKLFGSWKLSQNKSLADQKGVVEGLTNAAPANSNTVATLIQERLNDQTK